MTRPGIEPRSPEPLANTLTNATLYLSGNESKIGFDLILVSEVALFVHFGVSKF